VMWMQDIGQSNTYPCNGIDQACQVSCPACHAVFLIYS
jgi:hypothetical protein